MEKKDLLVITSALRAAVNYIGEDLEAICDETFEEYAKDTLAELHKAVDVIERHIEEQSLTSAREKAEKLLERDGFFYITSVHRDDLEERGFDVSNVTDKQMRRLANQMSDDYCNQLFHESMEILAEGLGIPRKEKQDEQEE